MNNRIQLVIASLVCLGCAAFATADPPQRYGDRPVVGQRDETPPSWAVGTWSGYNDFIRADITLDLDRDGRATMSQRFRDTTKNLRGTYRSGRIDFGRDRYTVRQEGREIALTLDANRRDSVRLRRTNDRDVPDRWRGRDELRIESPLNNDRVRSGVVVFRGTTNYPDVRIEARRDGNVTRSTTTTARGGGQFEARLDLAPGRYQVVFRSGERNRIVERSITLLVGGMGRVHIDSPDAGEKLRPGTINVSGTSEADEVEVEIYRGRDRVFIERVRVRDGRFNSKPSLGWGSYVLTVRSQEGGQVIGTDRHGFEVTENRGGGSSDIRLDRPSERGRYRGSVDFDGSAGARNVRIQIFRGSDRVYNEVVSVRDGHFHARVSLGRGHYEATIANEERGMPRSERRVGFDVD